MGKRSLIIMWAVLAASGARAQDGTDTVSSSSEKVQEMFDPVNPEGMAEFPGGEDSLRSFVALNFKRPVDVDTTGKIYVQFAVQVDGSVVDVVVKRGLNDLLDAELVRVFQCMPKWKPGTLFGKEYEQRIVWPIPFREGRPYWKPRSLQVSAEFPGGQDSLVSFIVQNFQEPVAIDTTGKIYVRLRVGVDGSVGNVVVQRGLHSLLDAELARVLQDMPKWKPGTLNGQVVEQWLSWGIGFRHGRPDRSISLNGTSSR